MFTKDSRTENFLTQMGVEFSYTNNLSLGQLATGWEEKNLARPVAIREDAVEQYATLMEAGSAAPAPIVFMGTQGMEILDGVQRVAAAQLYGATKLSAYIVSSDSGDTVCAIRVLANARLQGRAEPAEWTRRKAVEVLVVERGLSSQEVALMGGWSPADIQSIAESIAFSAVVQSIGGPELPDTMLRAIAAHTNEAMLMRTPEPIAKFLCAIKTARLSSADAEPYVEDFFSPIVKSAKSHHILTNRLEDFLSDPEIDTRIKGRRSPGLSAGVNLRRAMRTCLTVLDDAIEDGEQLPYIDEFFKLSKDIQEKLQRLAERHPKAATSRVPADMWGPCA